MPYTHSANTSKRKLVICFQLSGFSKRQQTTVLETVSKISPLSFCTFQSVFKNQMNNISPVITRQIGKTRGKKSDIILEHQRISAFILCHQLKQPLKNELVNLCSVSFAFFFFGAC